MYNTHTVLPDVRICQHMREFWKISAPSADFNICAEQLGCLRAWWVGAKCRRKVKKIMLIVHCFILFSVLVLSDLLNLIRRWRFEYWRAIMIIFKFWQRSLWNFLRNLFYDCFTSRNEIKNHIWRKRTSFWRSGWKYLAFDTHIGGVRICAHFFLKMRGFSEFSSGNTVHTPKFQKLISFTKLITNFLKLCFSYKHHVLSLKELSQLEMHSPFRVH